MHKYTIIAVCFLLALSGVTQIITLTQATQYTNVLLDCDTTTSSTSGGAFVGGSAVDGDVDTHWLNDAGGGEDWIYVDCVDSQLVYNVSILTYYQGASNFSVQRSFDAITWLNITSGVFQASTIETITVGFSPVDARYFRLIAYDSPQWVGISEFRMYGSKLEVPDVLQSSWLTFGALLVLSLVSLILAWKSNTPILNFVFGAITLGAAAYYLGTAMVFAGWTNLLGIVMGIMCILSGAIKLRG